MATVTSTQPDHIIEGGLPQEVEKMELSGLFIDVARPPNTLLRDNVVCRGAGGRAESSGVILERYNNETKLQRVLDNDIVACDRPRCLSFCGLEHCMYVWSSHIAEYGSTG